MPVLEPTSLCGQDDRTMADSSTPSDADRWYETAFGALYPLIYRHRDDAAALEEVEALCQAVGIRPAQTVLDVCCGDGRHLEALCRRGCDVVGVDLSQALLARAGERDVLRGRLVRADARALPFSGSFDVVVNLFTSFGYFDLEGDRMQLSAMVRALHVGGTLVVDLPDAGHIRRSLEPHTVEIIEGHRLEQHRHVEADRVVKHVRVIDPTGRVHEHVERVRLYDADRIMAEARSAGLADIRCWGDYDGAASRAQSPRMILVGKRA